MLQGFPWSTGLTSSPPRLYHSGERRPVPGTWPSTGRHRRHAPPFLFRSLGRSPSILYWQPGARTGGRHPLPPWPEEFGITRR